PETQRYHLITDYCGVNPCYSGVSGGGRQVLASHPDFLAAALGGSKDLDLVSMGEFLGTGRVSFPHSYYRGIKALMYRSVHSLALDAGEGVRERSQSEYARLQYEVEPSPKLSDLAEELASALSSAVSKRVQPRLGKTWIALSGGLDSRAILSSIESAGERVGAFCCVDNENYESSIAGSVARAAGIEMQVLRRSPDQYGEHAEDAVRITGGMGEIASAHFLGFRDRFRELGIASLLTGCYFDYLFKSLSLNTGESGLLRVERLRSFAHASYAPHFELASGISQDVNARQEALIPEALRADRSATGILRVAEKRIFPLWHEIDNAQRLIPQRVMQWYSPAIDLEVMEVFRRVPPEFKLNKKLFREMVSRVCGGAMRLIPDANTRAPVGASKLTLAAKRYAIAIRRRAERKSGRTGTDESWPNWVHYLGSSPSLRELWGRPVAETSTVLEELLGGAVPERIQVASLPEAQRFLRLLTLKIWLDQRQ
ncbi:MAG: asparagine synthase-related protein, partial [Planctomycetota bacterium]